MKIINFIKKRNKQQPYKQHENKTKLPGAHGFSYYTSVSEI